MYYLVGISYGDDYIVGGVGEFLSLLYFYYKAGKLTFKFDNGKYSSYIVNDCVLKFLNSNTSNIISIRKDEFLDFAISHGRYLNSVSMDSINSDIFCFIDNKLNSFWLYNDLLIFLNKFVDLSSFDIRGGRTVSNYLRELCTMCVVYAKQRFEYSINEDRIKIELPVSEDRVYRFKLRPNFNEKEFEVDYLAYFMLRS